MKKIIVLGAGMVGSAMAIDLSAVHDVTLTDLSERVLQKVLEKAPNLKIQQLDVTQVKELQATLEAFDLVVSAVPGFLGYQTLKNIIAAEKNVVDISFFPENALDLCDLAKQNKITAIVDCGVAPGMDNIILGYHNESMEITDFECLVGGLPKVKKWPFLYKAPFSPVDVIEEYTRPARYVEGGRMVTKPALSDCEYVEFEKVGTLESFNSDGLRSIIYTMPHIPNMKEKTLRYPGHVEYIKVLKESGFFEENPIEWKGQKIVPLEFTSKILFKEWQLDSKDEEMTVMRVQLKGADKNGQKQTITYDLHDEYCKNTGTSSMARTTGYTATAAANLIMNGLFEDHGVFPPELVGKYSNCFDFIMQYLKERNIHYHKTVELS